MKFGQGQPGNPGGRPKEKLFRDALVVAVKRAKDDRVALNEIATALVEKALGGDVPAIKEIAARLDGNVPQQQIVTGDEDGGPVQIREVRDTIVDPKNVG